MHARPHVHARLRRSLAAIALCAGLGSSSFAQQIVGPAPQSAPASQAAPYSSAAPEGIRTSHTAPIVDPAPPAALLEKPTTDRAATPLTPPDGRQRTKLAAPGTDGDSAGSKSPGGTATVVASLALVLGLFLVAAWLLRRGMPQQNRTLPTEAVESLGRIPFPGRQQGQLLRVGNKLVLVSFSQAGADVITEVTDPQEVDRLAGLCAQNDPHGSVRSFRDVVDGFFRDKPGAAGKSTVGRRPQEDDVA